MSSIPIADYKLGISIKEMNGVIRASKKGFSLRSIQDVPITTY